ncbi:MAG: indolepyruvate oxidoreductase subunit beta [Eggerthellaceae bacterium]|nr:indolepyruvate oxidoreductase subunit beta [Eggerthellaceae bacterium]
MTKMLLSGVGGQGTILAAHVIAEAAMTEGLDVKVSEIHGMAQRGGAVSTMVTFGDEVHSMVVGDGEADIVVSFDELEALRSLPALKRGGKLIVNDEVIKPGAVLTGKAQMPCDMDGILDAADALLVPAEATAREVGSAKCANVVMLGAVSTVMDLSEDAWIGAVRANVPPKTVDMNIEAFKAGRAFADEKRGR